jgi:hypothetical protein
MPTGAAFAEKMRTTMFALKRLSSMPQRGDPTLGNNGLESECGMVGSDGKRPTSSAWLGSALARLEFLIPGLAGPT